ncbi:hypothetical protein [Nesterenkonia sp.]|uniref:hypothetical protein n=1 Tax=Nesterenkonia sp. TaxID=704201 RepID=UPI00260D320A|nr:hypothetical protein [Nesterenkonia sp.]
MRRILLRALLVLLGAAVLHLLLWSAGLAAAPWDLGVAVAVVAAGALAVVVSLLLNVRDRVAEVEWFSPQQRRPRIIGTASDPRFNRLRTLVRYALEGEPRGAELHSELRRLAHARLQRRGVDPERDPQAAQQMLGEPLADFLSTPPAAGAGIDPETLNRTIARIEEL